MCVDPVDGGRGATLGVSRRRVLAGALGGAAGALAQSLAQAQSAPPAGSLRAKSVIMIFNSGAPSHLDLWDMKPDAPDTVRGEFQPIASNVPGIQVSELMPTLAQRVDKLAIVRSVHHRHTQHNPGMYWSIAGKPYRIDSTLINPGRTELPSFGTLVGWLAQQDGYSGELPPYVITPSPHCDSTKYLTPGQFGACLGPRFDPFVLNGDPNAQDFKVPELSRIEGVTPERMQARQSLLADLIGERGRRIDCATAIDYATSQEKAFAMISADSARNAFDLSREPDALRDKYGRHSWGQSHLLARRLVESGVRFVSTVNGPSIVWDTHKDNFGRMKDRLVPPMEQAFAALLDDLSERGLLETTLVVWMGDFGRTPIINRDAGRDHWPHCYTMVLAGGGIRGGIVYGESDRTGAYPKSHAVSPADIHATIFTALGYNPHSIHYFTQEGRPAALSDGQPIGELLA